MAPKDVPSTVSDAICPVLLQNVRLDCCATTISAIFLIRGCLGFFEALGKRRHRSKAVAVLFSAESAERRPAIVIRWGR